MFAWIQKLFGRKPAVKASPVLRTARIEPDAPWPRYGSNPRPLYAKPQAPPSPPPRRYYSAPAVTPNHDPAPDTSSDVMNTMLLASLMSSGSQASECRREPETEPFRSGGSGDFGGGGASGSWEAPAPSPSYDSGSSYSSSSSSDSSSSSSDSSSSSSSSSD